MAINVLYDGDCGLCKRTIRTLKRLNWLGHLRFVNYQDEAARMKIAPEISYEKLDKSMHIKWDTGRTMHGFKAMRAVAWHLPLLWPVAPFLYVPGIAQLGDAMYKEVATNRKACTHENCAL
jgi:predicted DCC family thiol-disulfide oxidoreductase YuxK